MRLLRFEKKILGAILAVAIVPLVASLLLGRVVLSDAYAVGVNPRVKEQLEEGLDVYRRHFETLRDEADRTGEAIASHWKLRAELGPAIGDPSLVDEHRRGRLERELRALLGRHSNVSRITLRAPGVAVEVVEPLRTEDASLRPLRLELEVEEPWFVEVVVTTPRAPFDDFQRAGELTEVYSRLEESSEYLSSTYLMVFIGFLVMVIALALAIGLVLSRRVTSRVADLVSATERVGAGDLHVVVQSGSQDEVGELTRAFNAMVHDLRESRERIDYLQRIGAWQEFARRLAHEIKNPLTPIQLAAQEMERSYPGDDPRFARALVEARSIIEEEVATLRRLVGEFSSFAKLPQAELATADLNDFVEDLVSVVDSVEEDVGVSLRLDLLVSDEPLLVEIDAMMLKRCVDNLFRNAAQAIKSAGRRDGGLWVRCRSEGPSAVLTIWDDGPGIPEEMQAHVFDPYLTTKREGTGLGLAIVKKVVLEHNAEVRCDDGPSGGAQFTIAFPTIQGKPSRRRA